MRINQRFLALCLALLLACVVLPAPAAQGADVQPGALGRAGAAGGGRPVAGLRR